MKLLCSYPSLTNSFLPDQFIPTKNHQKRENLSKLRHNVEKYYSMAHEFLKVNKAVSPCGFIY